jgi:glycosyltransferase involved in cell wall biosynthesis
MAISQYPKISVIVPVYKAEKYIHRCIDSILKQTFTDFEVLLIDDGSPDKSGEICNDYAQKDSRVRVFHKENGGVSSARQCGLDNAIGQYIIHVDPDDWIESNMLNDLLDKANASNADMVICDYYQDTVSTGNCAYIKQEPTSLDANSVLKDMIYRLYGFCWNKLIKRECFKKYNISFPIHFSVQEDLYVIMSLLKHNIIVSYISKAYYHYNIGINDNSLLHVKKYSENIYKEDVAKFNSFSDLMRETDYYRDTQSLIAAYIINRAFESNYFSSSEFRKYMFRYRGYIFNRNLFSIKYIIKLYLSCIGLYNLMMYLQNKQVRK